MSCEICDLVKDKQFLIYEDEKIIASLTSNPASLGHIVIAPKNHLPILEQIPDSLMADIFKITNQLSIAVFEALNVHGTNVLINNGVSAGQKAAHFSVNLIPRMEKDGLNLTWDTKKLSEEEMSTVELKLKEEVKNVGIVEKEKEKPISLDKKPVKLSGEENYLIRSLTKIP